MPAAHSPIRLVVSVCCARDLETWSVVSKAVVRHIKAERYLVVVPDAEIAAFEAATDTRYLVHGEDAYVGAVRATLLERLGSKKHRLGWYLQQLVKIEAVVRSDEGVVLIWDADTLPLKDLNVMTPDGGVVVYTAEEFHRPYFDTIERLLGLSRATNFSFIAQCLTVQSDWARACCAAMVARMGGDDWMAAVARAIDPAENSSFSEYETLGTWMVHHHPDKVSVSTALWFRHGSGLLGPLVRAAPTDLRRLSRSFDFVAFERWRARGRRWLQLRFALARLPWLRGVFFPAADEVRLRPVTDHLVLGQPRALSGER